MEEFASTAITIAKYGVGLGIAVAVVIGAALIVLDMVLRFSGVKDPDEQYEKDMKAMDDAKQARGRNSRAPMGRESYKNWR